MVWLLMARSVQRLLTIALTVFVVGLPARAQDISEPRNNRIYALVNGQATVAVASVPGFEWQVVNSADEPVRRWGAADAGSTVTVPAGGWYRLMLRHAGQAEGFVVGGRFAAGMVVLITGQSQAEALFRGSLPIAGAWPVTPAEPAQPGTTAVLEDCGAPQPWCAGDNSFWQPAPEGLGARLLLIELHRRWQVPVGLVNAAFGGASAAQLADPLHLAGNRLARLAVSAAPLNGAVILGHGTTDAFFPPDAASFESAMLQVLVQLRHNGPEGMPVLLSVLPPLTRPRPAQMGQQPWHLALMGWLGLGRPLALDPASEAQAELIRAAQRGFAAAHGLRDGGSLAGVSPGLDGIHWSEAGVREAARVTAAALVRALPGGGPYRRQEGRR